MEYTAFMPARRTRSPSAAMNFFPFRAKNSQTSY